MSSVVYLLDDDEAVRESVAAILQLNDVTVHTYASAVAFEGVQFEDDRSCLLIDVHLADGNGIEMLSTLRKKGVTIPAIVMSGRMEPGYSQALKKLAPVVWLEKPIDGDAVVGLLDELLTGS